MNASHKRNSWLRFFAFFILPAIVIYLSNTFLVQIDTPNALMLYELQERDDIELAFIGSSIVHYGICPETVEEECGLKTFNIGVPNLGQEGALAASRMLLEKNDPDYAVFFFDPMSFMQGSEGLLTQTHLLPYLPSPLDRLTYYLDLVSGDSGLIEHLLCFRMFPCRTWADVEKALTIHSRPEHYIRQMRRTNPFYTYMGSGYLRSTEKHSPVRVFEKHIWTYQEASRDAALSERTRWHIRQLNSLHEEHGAKFIVMLPPMPTVYMLTNESERRLYTEVSAFCREEGIPCYDLSLLRESAMPSLNPYFFDLLHLNEQGGRIFGTYLGRFFKRLEAGEAVDGDFYNSWEEYAHEIDYVASTYLEEFPAPKGRFCAVAGANTGLDVHPLYRFCVQDRGGRVTELRPYTDDPAFTCDRAKVAGKTVIVYAKPQTPTDHPPVRFLLPVPAAPQKAS